MMLRYDRRPWYVSSLAIGNGNYVLEGFVDILQSKYRSKKFAAEGG